VLFTRLWEQGRRIAPPRGNLAEDASNRLAHRIRAVGRSESADFLHWTRATEVLRGLDPTHQTYAMPVFRYAGLYLGLPAIFHTDTDTVDCELAWSPDTIRWERLLPGTPLIPRGTAGSCDSGCIYAAASPFVRNGRLHLYYLGANGLHTSWREGSLNLATLDPDHFAGYRHDGCSTPGRLRTRPEVLDAHRLRVTADCRRGWLRATVLLDGRPLTRSRALRANALDTELSWENPGKLAASDGRPVQLEFQLHRSQLFAYSG
jgi:hypothetical protein